MPTRQWDRYDSQPQESEVIRALPRSQSITRLPDTGSIPVSGSQPRSRQQPRSRRDVTDDRRERGGRLPHRKPSRGKGLMRATARTPLLLRTTITVGLIAAVAVSMARAGDGGMARNMIAGLQGNAVMNAGAQIVGAQPATQPGGAMASSGPFLAGQP